MDPSARNSSEVYLCLCCRQKGHVLEKCARYIRQWDCPGSALPPDAEPPRPSPPFHPFPINTIEGSVQALCQRCNQLDALSRISSHRPFVLGDLDNGHSKRATRKTTQIPSLGPIRTLRLHSTCPLCRLIFDLSHLTDEEMEIVRSGGELVVVTGWSIYRLERDLYWKGRARGKGPYAKCVYTSVTRSRTWADGIYEPKRLVEEAADAIGLIDVGGQSNDTPALGVRQVDPKTPDYPSIKDWFRRCDDLHHITCRPLVSEGLAQIKLVHVETRQIVMHPGNCDYIALSYVWGGVEQPSYKLGDILPTVPATLEDAMVVTRNLGKQYLWADSLCIEQENNAEKMAQIALMSAIYSGAWATIICLSGQSARSGLPRVGTLEGIIPQLSCEVWGKRLLSLMPTLSEQISRSPWVSRAWTYQEGLLSPRRLFFTNHQVYFECNSVQCCESLDDLNSPFHLPSDEERRAALDDVVQDQNKSGIVGVDGVIGRGVFRDPFRPISSAMEAQTDDDFTRYLGLVHSYTMKKMSHDADSLNAFSAMLTRLEENYYTGGFVEGLPVDDLPRALLWFHPAPPRRRVGFAAWSWAGWDGGVNDTVIRDAENTYDAIMPPLRIWRTGFSCHPELIYNSNPTYYILEEEEEEEDSDSWKDVGDSDSASDSESGYDSDDISEATRSYDENFGEIDFKNDPVSRLAKAIPEETPAIPAEIDGNELLIEGIVIRANLTETPRDHYSDSETDDEYEGRCFVRLEGQPKRQRMKFYGHDATQLAHRRSGGLQQEFLLLSREHQGTARRVYNSLLLIDRDGDVANRVGVASLRLDDVKLLDGFEPEWRLFKLK